MKLINKLFGGINDTGDTEIILELENGETKSYPISVKCNSYEIKYNEPDNEE